MIDADKVIEMISSINEADLTKEINNHEDQLSKLRSLRQRLFPKPLPELKVTIPTPVDPRISKEAELARLEQERQKEEDKVFRNGNPSKDVQAILNAKIEEGKKIIKEENKEIDKDPKPEPEKEFGDLKKIKRTNQALPMAIKLAGFFMDHGPLTLGMIAMKTCKKAQEMDKFLRSHEWFELDPNTHKWNLSQAAYSEKGKWCQAPALSE